MSFNKLLFVIAAACLPGMAFAAAPVIATGGVVNGATYTPGIAPGSWFTIFGSNLSSVTASVTAADLVSGSLPAKFGGTTVTVNGQAAYLNYVSPGQINAESPASTVTGPVQVVVTTADGTATATVIQSPVTPSVFASGIYAIAVRPADSTVINGTGAAAGSFATSASAKPGDVLELFANGLGATANGIQPGTVFSGAYATTTTPTVTIGGTQATVSYSGLIAAGLYQINITVPNSLSTGTYPVVITQNGVSSQATALLNIVPATTASTSVTLTSSAASTTAGTSVTLTANVTPASSTGTITFYEGPFPIGSAALSGGTASLTTAFSPGTHAVTAAFGTSNVVSSLASIIAVSATGTAQDCSASTGSAQIACLANTFLSTLSTTQQSNLLHSYTLANVEHWSNLPLSIIGRNGLRFGDLTPVQLSAVFALIQAAMSNDGLNRLGKIRGADETIAALNAGFQWGAANYFIAFYGTPSSSSPWMLQVNGHHFALNHTYNGKYTSASPYFLGTEPATYTVAGSSYSPLEKQSSAMYALNQTLLGTSSAKLTGTFDDVVMGVNGQTAIDTNFPQTYPSGTSNRGVLYSTLSADQQAKVKAAIEAWVSDSDAATATELLSIYEDPAALAATYIGYSGTGSMVTVGDYIRVDGPRVWAELVVQSGIAYRNSYHYHSIWRDKTADYGGDFQ